MKSRVPFVVFLLVAFTTPVYGQHFSPSQNRNTAWNCHGWEWISNATFFCSDIKTHQLSRVGLDGTVLFSGLQAPAFRGPKAVEALGQDADANLYVVDGMNIYVYSPEGKYQRVISPGINLSTGIAPLDSQHFYVAGRVPPKKGDSKATVFLVGPSGVEQGFSDVFVRGLSGLDDLVMNSASYLALDQPHGLLYQLPQNVYEIRVFDLKGRPVRTIVPPPQYALRAPQLEHIGRGVTLAPGDALSDIVVFPNGGLAISGDTLDFAETTGKRTAVSYSRFVDLYDPTGAFLRRLQGAELKLNDNYFTGFDHTTGKAYFKGSDTVTEAEVRQ